MNVLVLIDAFLFESDSMDGILDYMVQCTPIGKMHQNNSNRNFWALGPNFIHIIVAYEHPNSWSPTQVGIEGGLGVAAVAQEG
jgi:hypothetical protein